MADRVYWNLHKRCWSVKGKDGRVRARWGAVALLEPSFVVSEAGRQRVLRERRKNVHAYAKGAAFQGAETGEESRDHVVVTYSPYRCGFFYETRTGREVTHAVSAFLGSDRSVHVWGPYYGERNAYEEKHDG